MKIAVLGAGNVGGNLGRALAVCGHEVTLGVRDPNSEKARQAVKDAPDGMLLASIPDALAGAEVIALTIPWPAAGEVLESVEDWGGRIIIDATNRFGAAERSAGEDAARLAQGARVVKAFNIIGAEHYLDPVFNGERASMLLCGDDADAKRVVAQLCEEMGFDPVDAGPLALAGTLEEVARLWVMMARGGTGRNIAFRLIKR
jgi:8-hydroxy-5-deazaflavin:NADPH oxidoreductase